MTVTSNVTNAKMMTNGHAIQRQSSHVSKNTEAQAHAVLNSNSHSNAALDKFRHGVSLSPRTFAALQGLRRVWESPRTKTTASLIVLLGMPSVAFGSLFPGDSFCNHIIAIWSAWDGLLSIGSFLVMSVTIPSAFVFVDWAAAIPSAAPRPNAAKARNEEVFSFDAMEACCNVTNPQSADSPALAESLNLKEIAAKARTYVFSSRTRLFNCLAFAQLAFFLVLLGLVGPNSLVYPSWLWHPFLWGTYRVYDVDNVPEAMEHVCYYTHKRDLCLDDNRWELLSAGSLNRHNREDLRGVHAGQQFAEENSIVINVLARDIKENIPALRINVESLVPFFKHVALVVFENDSSDGTRDDFKRWALEAAEDRAYSVDLMECEGVLDCKLQRNYRDNVDEDYDYSSAIGEMHTYRNTAIQYILNDPKYKGFSHLLVLDVDLAVPFSPLGILHSLGLKPDHAVASSGRQPWPTAFGSLTTPYDLNGFRELNTAQTMGLEVWHRWFCGISPPGERWRSECDALGPTHLVAVLWNDRKLIDGEFYAVNSAFNGAVLYPINLLRESEAMYDKGETGQRCEHVGFHLAISKFKTMLVNRKWDMHLKPNFPGGAAWGRARKITNRITSTPKLMLTVLLTHLITVGTFVWATFTFGVYGIEPAVSWMLRRCSQGQTRRSRKSINRCSSQELDIEARTPRKAILSSPSSIRRSNGLNRSSSTEADTEATMSSARRVNV